jgi:outer membrane biosynthesis protein TonB
MESAVWRCLTKTRKRRSIGQLAVGIFISLCLHLVAIIYPYLGRSTEPPPIKHIGVQGNRNTFSLTLAGAPSAENAKPTNFSPDVSGSTSSKDAPSKEVSVPTRGIDLFPVYGAEYYPADKLTKKPRPTTSIDFNQPQLAGITGSGKIVMKLWINEVGTATEVELERSEFSESLSAVFLDSFKKATYKPGELAGRPVRSILRIELDFDTSASSPITSNPKSGLIPK